jgi:hypothetical protein
MKGKMKMLDKWRIKIDLSLPRNGDVAAKLMAQLLLAFLRLDKHGL